MPTGVDISDFTPDSTVYVGNIIGGNSTFATGNLGVGTITPDNKLTVKGANALVDVQSDGDGQTIGLLARYLNNNALGAGFRYTTGDAQLYIDNFYPGNNGVYSDITIRNCDTGGNLQTRIKIKGSSGNIGIGTTAPSTKLEVGDFLDAVTNKITVAARYEYEPEFNFRLGQSGTNLHWIGAVISSGDDGNYNGKILFKTANAGRDTPTTKMVIRANGYVGIGTTAPNQN